MKMWIDKMWSKHPDSLLKKPLLFVLNQFRSHIRGGGKKVQLKNLKTPVI
jgi:hypothetical protein